MKFVEYLTAEALVPNFAVFIAGQLLLVLLGSAISPRLRRSLRAIMAGLRLAGLDEVAYRRAVDSSKAELESRFSMTDEDIAFVYKTKALPAEALPFIDNVVQLATDAEDAAALLFRQTPKSLEERMRYPANTTKRLAESRNITLKRYQAVGNDVVNKDFYTEFADRMSRVEDRAIIVGEGVKADRGEEKSSMTKLVEGQINSKAKIVRIQTRPFISKWWKEVLEQFLDHGKRGGESYFSLYFGPPQFISVAVMEVNSDERACAEMMMPIGNGGYDPFARDEVERAGLGVFIDGEPRQARYLQRKIQTFLDSRSMRVSSFLEIAAPLIEARKKSGRNELNAAERMLLTCLVRVENKTELTKLCSAFDEFAPAETTA